MTLWLEFKEVKPDKPRKTKIYAVFNRHDNHFLGHIHWKGAWRQYVFDDEVLEVGKSCMEQFIEMFDKLEEDRKNMIMIKNE